MQNLAIEHARQNRERYREQLREYLRIPSISTVPEHREDIHRAAEWIAAEMSRIGLENVRVLPGDEHPFVYADWLHKAGAPTVLLYGHYDCQPVDPLEMWELAPFGAEIQGDRVYARGASDNKGQHFAHLKAFESLLAGGGLPVNVKVLLEGEEEIASPNIEPFLLAHQRLLAADSGIISDGAMIAEGRPSIDYGLRGVAALEVVVRGPERDLHSGSYGGTVLNPALALAQILGSLHDADGRIRIPRFYERVRPLEPDERKLLAGAGYDVDQWRQETGARAPWGEPDFELLERIGARPTCEVNGIWGGFQGDGVKTIIPARAGAKISMRLVPDQDPDEIARLFSQYIAQVAPAQVDVQVSYQAGCWPALMSIDSAEIEAARKACTQTWDVEPVFTRGGGSLPVVAAFRRILGTPFVLVPLGLDDNRHSPNEHIRLDYFYRGIETAIRYYSNLS